MSHETTRYLKYGKARLTTVQKAMAVFSVTGAIVAILPSFLLALGMTEWFTRMECGPGSWGSGCYEETLGLSAIVFAFFYLPFFVPSLWVAIAYRKGGLANWWPFIVLCAVPLAILLFFGVALLVNAAK